MAFFSTASPSEASEFAPLLWKKGAFCYAESEPESETSVTPLDFHGVLVKRQPKRPFSWIAQDIQPGQQPDAEPDPAMAELPRYTFFEIHDAVQGDDDSLWYDIGRGRWVRQTHLSIVDVSPRKDDVGSISSGQGQTFTNKTLPLTRAIRWSMPCSSPPVFTAGQPVRRLSRSGNALNSTKCPAQKTKLTITTLKTCLTSCTLAN